MQHCNCVSLEYGGQAVGDGDDRALMHHMLEGLLHQVLTFSIKGAGEVKDKL